MMDDQEMERALALDGVKLEQLTGQDHGPRALREEIPNYYWEDPHDFDSSEEESLDDAVRDAIERASGGPVFSCDPATNADAADQQALMRVIGMISIASHRDAARVAQYTSVRQAASETPADFIRRISLALLAEMAGVE